MVIKRFTLYSKTCIYIAITKKKMIKVGLSSSKQNCFIYSDENLLKMTKNASLSRCLNFCLDFLVMKKSQLD